MEGGEFTTIDHGLTSAEVFASRRYFGSNVLVSHRRTVWQVFARQLNNPLLVILAITTVVAYNFDDHVNAIIIFMMLTVSVMLGFINEYSSERSVSNLLKHIAFSSIVIRNGEKQDVPVGEVVEGDIVLLHQGNMVPADIRILRDDNLLIDESALTGESMPVAKHSKSTDSSSIWARMGTVVVGGNGTGVVVEIAGNTEYGKLSQAVQVTRPKTPFQRGLAELASLMTKVITVMAVTIGVLNIGLGKPPIEAILFALAIAIGLTPALLPIIVTVSMAKGAHRMAKFGVVVKNLLSIEDLGNMQILCTDKTGTLTEGKINLVDYVNMRRQEDEYVLQMGLLCNTATVHHKIVGNPMDAAIWEGAIKHHVKRLPDYQKVAEQEFSYEHRGQLAVVEHSDHRLFIFKGSADAVLERSATYRNEHGHLVSITHAKAKLREQFQAINADGLRIIAVGQRTIHKQEHYDFKDAKDLELLGFMTFLDVPKQSAKHALDHLNQLGIQVKILTGDNEIVTRRICEIIGLPIKGVLTGPAIERLSARELQQQVLDANLFCRISPQQKEQVINALKRSGNSVGFMGDGVNDAAALHGADVSLSVNTGVDIAKDLADIVLLRKGLDVIAEGVKEGRRIFANTIKYILMGTSSNFGNMFSMAGASFIFRFLPMTPTQILLNNSLYDMSQLGIPGDEVDEEVLLAPQHWDIKNIYRYMLFFGPISSIFDYLTFALLWFGFHARPAQFQTGWFLVSIFTQVLVVFLIRTQRWPFWKSRPNNLLFLMCLLVLLLAVSIPYMPFAHYLNFMPPSLRELAGLAGLVGSYLIIVELVKNKFLKFTLNVRRVRLVPPLSSPE